MRIRHAILAAVASAFTSACHAPSESTNVTQTAPSAIASDSAATRAGANGVRIEGARGSSRISGSVLFRGPVPAFREPSAPFPECGARTPQDPLRVSSDGHLANVFVYIKDGLPPGDYALPAAPLLLDQRGCDYQPRVFGIRAGQQLVIRNSDKLLHNVRSHGDGAGLTQSANTFNVAMPNEGMTLTKTFPEAQVPVALNCDVHPWMRAYAGVVAHPFFAVTGDDGAFSLSGLPAGTYTLEAWHERLGRTSISIKLGADESANANLEFKP